jgi:hypothetical protein
MDEQIRKAYRGGYCIVNEKYKNKLIGRGVVYDINSAYPHVMRNMPLPCGKPVYFRGQYEEDKNYPLYVQHVILSATLKENYLPIIQIKHSVHYNPVEYQKNIIMEEFTFTNYDIELIKEHYNIDYIDYCGGYKFIASSKMFHEYVDKWYQVKSMTTGGKKLIAKLFLNSLYGKFGTNPDVTGKYVTLDESGDKIKFVMKPPETRKPVYIPVAVFVTSHQRYKMIKAAQANYDRFIYCDTDSLHLIGDEEPNLDIHDTELGMWSKEANFTKAKFIRAKTYIEERDGKIYCKAAGMPESLKKHVTFKNFKIGQVFGAELDGAKLIPKIVKGGCVLVPTSFKILI